MFYEYTHQIALTGYSNLRCDVPGCMAEFKSIGMKLPETLEIKKVNDRYGPNDNYAIVNANTTVAELRKQAKASGWITVDFFGSVLDVCRNHDR